MFSVQLFFGLAMAQVVLCATYTVTKSSSATSSVVCYTKSSSKSPVTIKTVYTSTTLPPDFSIYSTTSTPYKTITPKVSTTTSISTSFSTTTITPTTPVSTFTETNSFNTTITSVATVTSTETDTSVVTTSVTSTSIVAAPTDFMDISDTTGLMNAMNAAPAQQALAAKAVAGVDLRKGTSPLLHSYAKANPVMYEYAVRCVTRIQPTYILEVIKVHSTVKTTLAPSTTTVTSVSTSIVTTSTVSTASTTVTVSTTSTSTETNFSTVMATTSITSTFTMTAVVSTYAACGMNNLLGPALTSGNTYQDRYAGATQNFESSTGTNAYDCCALCMTTPGCVYSAFLYFDADPYCENYLTDGSCPSGQPISGTLSTTSGPNSLNDTYSNGPCGSMVYAGNQ